jgi:tryptophan halogenase
MSRPRQIVVVGRDADLWLTATSLRAALGPAGVDVTAVELPSRLGPSSVYATLPPLESLHARLGLDEAALLRATGGSFSLGYNLILPDGVPFFLAHGAYGAAIDGADFFPFWVKARRFGLGASLEDFSPTAMAARHGRMLVPDEDTELFGRTDYAYHLPAIAYSGTLKNLARKLGVAVHESLKVGVEADGGVIRSLTPGDGSTVTGDLFVDASGPDAVLHGELPGTVAEDWRAFFPFDRCLTAIGQRFQSVPGYGELRLAKGSGTALIATQGATHVVHAFRSDWRGDAPAMSQAAAASGLTLDQPTGSAIGPAIRTEPWSGNCVAIGSSACALDPLLDAGLHIAQLGIVHLLSLVPAGADAAAERAEYNRITRSLFERLRDFQAALLLPAGASAVPRELRHKIDTFQARGTIAPMEDETFSPDQWRALFVAQGIAPESWSPAIENVAPDRMKEDFRRILGFVRAKVTDQPTHDSYLTEIGAGRVS